MRLERKQWHNSFGCRLARGPNRLRGPDKVDKVAKLMYFNKFCIFFACSPPPGRHFKWAGPGALHSSQMPYILKHDGIKRLLFFFIYDYISQKRGCKNLINLRGPQAERLHSASPLFYRSIGPVRS